MFFAFGSDPDTFLDTPGPFIFQKPREMYTMAYFGQLEVDQTMNLIFKWILARMITT